MNDYVKQIANAIGFLHENGIVHRDLKPDNILVQQNSSDSITLKLIDFGLSKVMGVHETTNEPYGSICYTAPEIIKGNGYTHKVDLWSFGVLSFYMQYALLPFDDVNDSIKNIIENIKNSNVENIMPSKRR